MTFVNKAMQFLVEHSDQLRQSLNKTVLDQPQPNEAMSALCRKAATEGIVLLKNDGLLPLEKKKKTAFFGRIQNDYFYVGYGSGGDVNPLYRVSPMDALGSRPDICFDEALAEEYRRWCADHVPFEGTWGTWPTYFDEMPLSAHRIRQSAETADQAVVFLGRAMGESLDNKPKKGCFYLTDREQQLLDDVTGAFRRVAVVIDAGNVIDLAWTEAYGDKISALLYAWQGGMESGNALVDILYGDANPSGKLTDTVARHRADYPAAANFGGTFHNNYAEDIYVGYRYFETFAPETVLFPFGFGLSYTTFAIESRLLEDTLDICVTNTGNRPGAQVVQVYIRPPQGRLGKPVRNLAAFRKTRLLAPGEKEHLQIPLDLRDFASFDDSGCTGYPNAWVLEPGDYEIYVGSDVRSAPLIGTRKLDQLHLVEQASPRAVPVKPFRRLKPCLGKCGKIRKTYEPVPCPATDLKQEILSHLPEGTPITGNRGICFSDVCAGNASLDDFVAQLGIEDLDCITRGEGEMHSPLGTAGNAGILGGTTKVLRELGIPVITTTDGPSGIRISYHTALLPCGTALACSWNPELIQQLGALFGAEMARHNTQILLGPGLNIHRDPLCGRNFEYFSEDPLVSGKIAAAMIRGIQSVPGRSACPKHFACNNQEWMRMNNDSRLSQRALREIYLRGFEICVKESKPLTLMTSYNKINGVWGHYHYELATAILREEWGYEGLVITDWWMQPAKDPNFPRLSNNAYRVRAQVDVLMPGGDRQGSGKADDSLIRSYHSGGITLGELQRCAKNVLRLCMALKTDS